MGERREKAEQKAPNALGEHVPAPTSSQNMSRFGIQQLNH